MIVDAHTHFFREFGSVKGLAAEEFVRNLSEAGVDKAIVFTLEGFFGNPIHENDRLAERTRDYPGLLYPFATVDPRQGKESCEELKRCVEKLGMRGVKFHPWLQAFSVTNSAFFPIVETAIGLDIPLVFHDGTPPYCTTEQIARLAEYYPDAKIILGHSGLKDFWFQALSAAQRCHNLYLCLCSSPLAHIRAAVEAVGAQRMMLGSDFPFAGREYLEHQIALVTSETISEEDKTFILGKTALELLKEEADPMV